jgi:hypothetical protein
MHSVLVVVGSLKPSKLVWDMESQGRRKDEVFVVIVLLHNEKETLLNKIEKNCLHSRGQFNSFHSLSRGNGYICICLFANYACIIPLFYKIC